jgi:tyrosyl-tRNA synthetase
LLNAAGQKMGKSVDGAIWVNKEKLPSYDFYQYLRNTEDGDVPMLLRRLTTLPMDEIAKLEQLQGQEINEAKKILAFEATKWCRGEDEAKSAEATAIKTFEQGGLGDDLPRINIPRGELESGIGVLDLMQRAGLVASNGEARRLIKGGGARINDNKVDDAGYNCTLTDLNSDGVIKLSAGKKKHALVEAA